MIRIEDILSSGIEEAEGIAKLAQEAEAFLSSHKWCHEIISGYFDRGWSGIVGVFYFNIEPGESNADNSVWVIVGDLPPAYIVVDECPNGAAAIDGYVGEMRRWVDAVKNSKPVNNLIPVLRRGSFVSVESTTEFAEMLESRLDVIDREILTLFENELSEET